VDCANKRRASNTSRCERDTGLRVYNETADEICVDDLEHGSEDEENKPSVDYDDGDGMKRTQDAGNYNTAVIIWI